MTHDRRRLTSRGGGKPWAAVWGGIVFVLWASTCAAREVDIRRLAATLPAWEVQCLLDVADEYSLYGAERKLLLAIRKHENGAVGLELGVGAHNPDHPARRFSDAFGSLQCQGRWAAGTIRKRYRRGDLPGFAQVYCWEDWQAWLRSVSQLINM